MEVGQGDATLIVTPDRKRILIDAGPMGAGVAYMLKRAGIDTIDLVIASHNHADHIGGMPDVFAALVVRAYMDNGIPHTSATYRRTIAAASVEPGLQYLQATERTVRVGSVDVSVLPPVTIDQSQNNNSVGVVVAFGNFTAIYTGDSEYRQIASWLTRAKIQQVTLVKSAHHGAANGTTQRLISATSPKIVVISVGGMNRYGHPSDAVIQRWADAKASVYRTDLMGTIEVTANRSGAFTVRTYRP